jgi:hypothetical protein
VGVLVAPEVAAVVAWAPAVGKAAGIQTETHNRDLQTPGVAQVGFLMVVAIQPLADQESL